MSLGTGEDLFQKLQCSTRQWLDVQLDDFASHKSTDFPLIASVLWSSWKVRQKKWSTVTAETSYYFITLLDTLKGNAFGTRKFHLQKASMHNFLYGRRGGILHVYSEYLCFSKYCTLERCLSSNLQNISLVGDHYLWVVCLEKIKLFLKRKCLNQIQHSKGRNGLFELQRDVFKWYFEYAYQGSLCWEGLCIQTVKQ